MDELAPEVLNEMTSRTANALAQLKASYVKSLELRSQPSSLVLQPCRFLLHQRLVSTLG